MKRFWKISLAVLLISAVCAPALAWEFTMTGEHEYRWRYMSRTGTNDLFGFSGAQESTGCNVGFAGPNIWNTGPPAAPAVNAIGVVPVGGFGLMGAGAPYQPTMLITRGGTSRWGSDGYYVDQRLTFVPTIRVNEAVRVHGMYNIGGFRNMYNMSNGGNNGNITPFVSPAGAAPVYGSGVGVPPFERYMPVYTSDQSAMSTAAIGSWEQVRATVQVPWGILSYGLKDFPLGVGLFSTQRLRGSSFVFIAPYGPFRFIGAIWELSSFMNGQATYNFRPDGTNKATWFGATGFTYDSGPMAVSGIWVGRNVHREANADAISLVTPRRANIDGLGQDENINLWSLSMKYNNGRFFANAGYDWYTRDFYYLRPLGGALPPAIGGGDTNWMVPGLHQEAYHLMAELGMFSGPTKVTLLWAQASGPVLNANSAGYANLGYGNNFIAGPAGTILGRNPNIQSGFSPKQYVTWGIDWQTMDPYQYLMFGVYGGGNQSYTGLFISDDTKGNMSDAYAFAIRADYAVASNLNVYGTYLWAHRLEAGGTFMGQYTSDGTAAHPAERALFRQNIGAATDQFERYVPDGRLGWEITLGADWKLLEGLTLRTRYAYWQPGDWFNYAYQAVMPGQDGSVVTGPSGIAHTHWGYLGSRDPIQAFEGSLFINF